MSYIAVQSFEGNAYRNCITAVKEKVTFRSFQVSPGVQRLSQGIKVKVF